MGWIERSIKNCRTRNQAKITGSLKRDEMEDVNLFWIKRDLERHVDSPEFENNQKMLNLQLDERGVYIYKGRIQGEFPIYLCPDSTFTEKLVFHCHLTTLHGLTKLPMAKVRECLWVPRLRSLVKRVIKSCNGCNRFRGIPFNRPPVHMLPKETTEGERVFQVVSMDHTGPIYYKVDPKREGKAYILLYACSLTRAVYMDLMKDQTSGELIMSLKRLIARKGRPETIYSDNAKTFIATAKWLKKALGDEETNDFLAKNNINWRFNLSRTPWWGDLLRVLFSKSQAEPSLPGVS